jgi:O-antigen ligase
VLFINRKAILAILKNKRKFILVVGGVIAFICVLPNAIASFSKVMRIDALKSIGLSDYSADRIPMIQEGFEYVRGHELFGIANKGIASSNFYIECFPIDIYVQLGCVGLLLYLLWFGIITKKLFKKSRFKDGSDLAKVIYMTILVVSLFSANAPMGPGTAYSLAWLVIGMYWNHSLSMEEK